MQPFRYVRPRDQAAALEAGHAEGAAFIAGGTGMVDLLKLGVEKPASLVDLTGAADAPAAIEETPEGIRIGALARNSDVAHHPLVRRRLPVLSQALLSGASPQLRNMATVGGNLLQRTRCAYFRDLAWPCNKRQPGSGCSALDGENRMHAVLGVEGGSADRCIAVHPSDMCVALVALDAIVHTLGRKGARTIQVGDLHALPGDHPEVEHILEPGELITHVTVPASARAARSCYVKVRDRAAFAFALSSAAVALDLSQPGPGGRIRSARVALGGVATKPWRALEVEQALVDRPATRAAFEHAAALAVKGARTTPDNAFKVVLIQRTIVRALERAAGVET
jgi:xanthine dehydrogenase YagS FAD-binding subunit